MKIILTFETVQREISALLATATILIISFGLIAGLHFAVAKIADFIGPGTFLLKSLYFAEVALLGTNAFLLLLFTGRAIWRIFRAFSSGSSAGEGK